MRHTPDMQAEQQAPSLRAFLPNSLHQLSTEYLLSASPDCAPTQTRYKVKMLCTAWTLYCSLNYFAFKLLASNVAG